MPHALKLLEFRVIRGMFWNTCTTSFVKQHVDYLEANATDRQPESFQLAVRRC